MAIVRELTTLLDFQLDASGVAKYEAAANKIKEIGIGLGKIFGIAFAASKIYEVVDGIIHAGKEVNILTYQLGRMARAGDDMAVVQDRLFQTAQDTGIEYTQTLETYKEFLNESKELNVSQDQLLDTTSNIFKALRLGAASPEAIKSTMATFERSFRMGRMGRRQFGMLTQEAPEVVKALEEGLGKSREELEAMAKAGSITAKMLIEGLGKSLPKLAADFAARPRKLGEAFNYAWNAAVKLSAQLWKLLSANSLVAKGIIWLTDQVVNFLTRVTNALGGLEHVVEGLEILLAVVFGPRLIMMLGYAVAWTWRWVAALTAADLAAAALQVALVGGILAAVIAIQDFMVWMRGGKSEIGDWLGPFAQFKDKMINMFTGFLDPIKQQFEKLGIIEAFKNVKAYVETEFMAFWNSLNLTKVFQELKNFLSGEFTRFWTDLQNTFNLVDKATTSIHNAIVDMIAWLDKGVASLNNLINAAINAAKEVKKFLFGETPQAPNLPPAIDETKIPSILRVPARPLPDRFASQETPQQTIDNAYAKQKMLDFMGLMFAKPLDIPGVLPGQMTPGAAVVAPGGTQDNSNTINQTNNIRVDADMASIAAEVKRAMDTSAQEIVDSLARQAQNASPRVEALAH